MVASSIFLTLFGLFLVVMGVMVIRLIAHTVYGDDTAIGWSQSAGCTAADGAYHAQDDQPLLLADCRVVVAVAGDISVLKNPLKKLIRKKEATCAS